MTRDEICDELLCLLGQSELPGDDFERALALIEILRPAAESATLKDPDATVDAQPFDNALGEILDSVERGDIDRARDLGRKLRAEFEKVVVARHRFVQKITGVLLASGGKVRVPPAIIRMVEVHGLSIREVFDDGSAVLWVVGHGRETDGTSSQQN